MLYHPGTGQEISVVERKIEWGAWSVLVGEDFYATADTREEAYYYANQLASGNENY